MSKSLMEADTSTFVDQPLDKITVEENSNVAKSEDDIFLHINQLPVVLPDDIFMDEPEELHSTMEKVDDSPSSELVVSGMSHGNDPLLNEKSFGDDCEDVSKGQPEEETGSLALQAHAQELPRTTTQSENAEEMKAAAGFVGDCSPMGLPLSEFPMETDDLITVMDMFMPASDICLPAIKADDRKEEPVPQKVLPDSDTSASDNLNLVLDNNHAMVPNNLKADADSCLAVVDDLKVVPDGTKIELDLKHDKESSIVVSNNVQATQDSSKIVSVSDSRSSCLTNDSSAVQVLSLKPNTVVQAAAELSSNIITSATGSPSLEAASFERVPVKSPKQHQQPSDLMVDMKLGGSRFAAPKNMWTSDGQSYTAAGSRHRLPQTVSYNKPNQVLDLAPVTGGSRQMQALPLGLSKPYTPLAQVSSISSATTGSRGFDLHGGQGNRVTDPRIQPPLNLSVDCAGAINLKSSPANMSTSADAVNSPKETSAMNLKMPSLLNIRDIQPSHHIAPQQAVSRQSLLSPGRQMLGGAAQSFSYADGAHALKSPPGIGMVIKKSEPQVLKPGPSAYPGPAYIESPAHVNHSPVGQPVKKLETQSVIRAAHGMKTSGAPTVGATLKIANQSRQMGTQPITIKQVVSPVVGVHHRADTVLSFRGGSVSQRFPSQVPPGSARAAVPSSLIKDSKMSSIISPPPKSPKSLPMPVRSMPYLLQTTAVTPSSHSFDRQVQKSRPSSFARSLPSYDSSFSSPYDGSMPISLVTSSESQRSASLSMDVPMDMSQGSKKLKNDQPTDMSRPSSNSSSLKPELPDNMRVNGIQSTDNLPTKCSKNDQSGTRRRSEFGHAGAPESKEDEAVRMDSVRDDKTSVSAINSGDGTSGQASMTVPAVDLNENKTGTSQSTNGVEMKLDETENSRSVCVNCGKAAESLLEGCYCSNVCMEQFSKKKWGPGHPSRPSSDNGEQKKKKRKAPVDEEGGTSSKQFCPSNYKDGEVRKSSKSKFSWSHYLQQEQATAAPARIFRCPFPVVKMGFRAGMKLEGIDPRHPSLYCVLTVAEIRGFRLRLHFDEYSECFDFWTNADSPFIFPVGWVEKNGKVIQPPIGCTAESFDWNNYLKTTSSQAAPKNLFPNTPTASVTPNSFRVGMKLEAIDKKSTSQTCVASVADVLGDRILVHFDGWEDIYDYWCDLSSPYIHPVGWCQEMGKPLSPPNDCLDVAGFTWEDYFTTTKSQPVPARAFRPHPAHGFEVGMKLEVVDKRNPILVRVSTVVETEPYRIKIHFDGWSDVYDYWVDDDCPDLHPAGWCYKTGHPLTPPLSPAELVYPTPQGSCPTPGCNGIGHIKGAKYTGHHSAFGCPYSTLNMNKEWALHDRLLKLESEAASYSSVKPAKNISSGLLAPEQKKCPTPGCDGSGHITGKYVAHYRRSGCPLAADRNLPVKMSSLDVDKEPALEQKPNEDDKSTEPPPNIIKLKLVDVLPVVDKERPLFGPGSGRGRKKKKVLRMIQEQQKKLEASKNINSHSTDSSSSIRHSIHQSVFMPTTPTVAPRDLPMSWDQQSKLLPGVNQYKANIISEWSVAEVAEFVSSLPGCAEFAKVFTDEQIDGEAFLLLTQADIVKVMNIKLGPAIKIYNSILMIKNNVDV